MPRFLFALICSIFSIVSPAQDVRSVNSIERSRLPEILGFEAQQSGDTPAGWTAVPAGTVFLDNKIIHSGHWSARLERGDGSSGGFSSIHQSVSIDFAGSVLELRGFLRTEKVSDMAGLWMREDGDTPTLAFDNMASQNLKGTSEWKEYAITLPLNPEAKKLAFGVLLSGTGRAWADDLQLLIDGKPLAQAPTVERPRTILELDTQFDKGSGIEMNGLTKVQIDNFVTLGKVWGFLKYHHPVITSGKRHWDYELFRILPAVLNAPDRASANAALLKWIAALGNIPPCQPCAALDQTDLQLHPDLDWTLDQAMLGAELSRDLQSVYRNRSAKQYYVGLAAGVNNPAFQHELAYQSIKLPDAGFQLLALYRFWNIIEYWFPYRDVLGENWDKVLEEFIPRVALARDSDAYQRELMAALARAHDSHTNLWSSLALRPPQGECQLPVTVRFVEDRPVVTGFPADHSAKDTGLAPGDAITELDGVPVAALLGKWMPYYAGSNDAARQRDIAQVLTRGECGDAVVGILRSGQELKIKEKRIALRREDFSGFHDLPGEAFRLLSKDVAYLKLSAVKGTDATHYIEGAAGTKGLIIDIRNYPSDFMVFELGQLLVAKETEFVRFTQADLANSGAFHWSKPESLTPRKPHYTGKVVILVDEVSQSQSEFTTMAFRAAPDAVVVGSTTAGADGNISPYLLPVSLRTVISGLGVFYPDKKPTQRVGILPDVQVRPTIAGIRAGRDEVLEEALRQILGHDVPTAEIQKLYKPKAM